MFIKMWKEEFQAEKFKLTHYPPEDFTRCCWQKTEEVLPIWVAYRTIIFLYFLATSVFSYVDQNGPKKDRQKYMIFLTNWTYLIEFVQFFIGFLITVIRYAAEKKNPATEPMDKMPWHYGLYWALFTMALPSAIVVTVVFWVSVYDPGDAHYIFVHVFNSVFMVLDFFLVAHPVRFLHFYLPAIYGILYALFSVIYFFCGGTGVKGMIPIYKILDWRKPLEASLTTIGCLFFLLFLHFIFAALSLFKFWIKKKKMETL